MSQFLIFIMIFGIIFYQFVYCLVLFAPINGSTIVRFYDCPPHQHNNTKHNDTQHNDTQHNDTQHNDTQYNNIQHYDT